MIPARSTTKPVPHTYRRRGSAYLLIAAVSMLVSIMGLSAIALSRLSARLSDTAADYSEAGVLALAAVDHGLEVIQNDPNWHEDLPRDVPVFQYPYGNGEFAWMLTNETEVEPPAYCGGTVRLWGIGEVGQVTRSYSVLLQVGGIPLELLGTALHAGTEVFVKSGKSITVTGAPLSCNGLFNNDEIVYGDVEAVSAAHPSTVIGTVTIPSPPKAMPDAGVLTRYISLATPITYAGDINKQVLGPGCNPWGATNPDGVYVIDTLNHDLRIQASRIYGTLIVLAGSKKVVVENESFLHSYRADYPVLIVSGDVELKLKSDSLVLDEATAGTNFNPTGAPYEGESDGDLGDVYPTEVQGLVHVTGNLNLFETTRVRGAVICELMATCEGQHEIVHDAGLLTNPPLGYASGCQMSVVAGSWQWEAPP